MAADGARGVSSLGTGSDPLSDPDPLFVDPLCVCDMECEECHIQRRRGWRMSSNRVGKVLLYLWGAFSLSVVLGFADWLGNFRFAQSVLNFNLAWYVIWPAATILYLVSLYVGRKRIPQIAAKYQSKAKFYAFISVAFIAVPCAFASVFTNATAWPTLLFGSIQSSYVVLNGVHRTCKYNVQCGTEERSIHYRFPGYLGTAHYFNLPYLPMFHFDILPNLEVKNSKPGTCLRLSGPTTILGVWVQQVAVVNRSFCYARFTH